MNRKLVVVTLLLCVVAILFPPWGTVYGPRGLPSLKFETFAFLFSNVEVLGRWGFTDAHIMWKVLGLEILGILILAFALHFFLKK